MQQQQEQSFDLLPIPYIAVAPDGRILDANALAAELFSTSRESLLSRSIQQFVAPAHVEKVQEYLSACVASARLTTLTCDVLGSDDRLIPVQISARAGRATHSQGDQAVRATITDITELRRVQDELRETNAEQEAFTYSISHDLRAPLITITNYSEFLATEHGEQLDETARDVLGRIQRAAQRMDSVLQNLLTYSRVGRAQMDLAAVDIGSVVAETVIQHHGLIEEAGAHVHVQPSFPKAIASRELLGQVFSNLLTNALKYTTRGTAPTVHFTSRVEESSVIITVADEGIGIAPEDHSRIFKMFERLHGQSAYPGTGIGLAVVHRAVERMNGKIWVESELNRGSRFHLALPQAG